MWDQLLKLHHKILVFCFVLRAISLWVSCLWSIRQRSTTTAVPFPCLECCKLLDYVQKKAIRLVGDASLTNSLTSLEHTRTLGTLVLFYRYFHGRCSSSISAVVSPLAVSLRLTRSVQYSHPFVVTLETCCLQELIHPRNSEANCLKRCFPFLLDNLLGYQRAITRRFQTFIQWWIHIWKKIVAQIHDSPFLWL